MDLKLADRRVLVTGSSAGIGAGVAKMMAAEGAKVIVHGRNEERAAAVAAGIRQNGGQVAYVTGDLGSDKGAAAVAASALAAFGGVDVLINNAGGRDPELPREWFDIPLAAWLETYQSNVMAAVGLIHGLVGPMRERKWGRVINIASFGAQSTSGRIAEYSAAKNAMVNMTISLGKTLRRTGVTVNTISPGVIRTNPNETMISATMAALSLNEQQAIDHVIDNVFHQTVGRLGVVEDIAAACCYLASPLADFVSGTNLRVDGGASQAVN